MEKNDKRLVWFKIAISIAIFCAIIGIYFGLKAWLYSWSITTIKGIEEKRGEVLKTFCTVLAYIGGQSLNILTVYIFTAMFKRRHQAFSYLVLWSSQVFLIYFF